MIERAIDKSLHERKTMRIRHHLPNRKRNIVHIAERFCDYFGITSEVLFSDSQKDEIVEYKRLFIAHVNPLFGPSKVGRFMGYKDHSTVIHHAKTHENMMELNADYRFKYLKFKLSV